MMSSRIGINLSINSQKRQTVPDIEVLPPYSTSPSDEQQHDDHVPPIEVPDGEEEEPDIIKIIVDLASNCEVLSIRGYAFVLSYLPCPV